MIILNKVAAWKVSKCSVSLRIQSEWGKLRTRKNSIFGHFPCSEWYDTAFQIIVSSVKLTIYCISPKMVRHTQAHLPQDFKSFSDHFRVLRIKRLTATLLKKRFWHRTSRVAPSITLWVIIIIIIIMSEYFTG